MAKAKKDQTKNDQNKITAPKSQPPAAAAAPEPPAQAKAESYPPLLLLRDCDGVGPRGRVIRPDAALMARVKDDSKLARQATPTEIARGLI